MQQVLLVFLFNMENCFNTVKICVNPVTTMSDVILILQHALMWQAVASNIYDGALTGSSDNLSCLIRKISDQAP